MRLIDYTEQYLILLDVMTDPEREIPEDHMFNLLNEIKEDREEKLNSCGWVYREFVADTEKIKSEINRLKEKLERAEHNAERLKNYISYCLQGEKIKTKSFDFSFRKSEQVELLGDVPEQYQRVKTTIEPDKTLIKQDLKAGASLDFARLIEKQNLQIK